MNATEPTNEKTSKTVLVVEDSPVQALVLIELLEEHNLQVISASNGSDGVCMAREYRPDLIVLDIQMPEMNGLEACRAIKQDPTTQDIPIIFLTAHDQPELLREGLGSGAIDFIPKDAFSNIVLLKTLDQLGLTSTSAPGEAA